MKTMENNDSKFNQKPVPLIEGQTDMQLSTFMLIANALGLRFSLVIG